MITGNHCTPSIPKKIGRHCPLTDRPLLMPGHYAAGSQVQKLVQMICVRTKMGFQLVQVCAEVHKLLGVNRKSLDQLVCHTAKSKSVCKRSGFLARKNVEAPQHRLSANKIDFRKSFKCTFPRILANVRIVMNEQIKNRRPSIQPACHVRRDRHELRKEVFAKEVSLSQPLPFSCRLRCDCDAIRLGAESPNRIPGERGNCDAEPSDPKGCRRNDDGSPSTASRERIPPDNAVIYAKPIASKHTLQPKHFVVPLWNGRHSATSCDVDVRRTTLTTVKPPRNRRTKLREDV